MEANIWKKPGAFSQRVLNKLIDQGMVREQAYDAVQPQRCAPGKNKYHSSLIQEDLYQQPAWFEVIDELFDLTHHSKQVDQIFARVGLE